MFSLVFAKNVQKAKEVVFEEGNFFAVTSTFNEQLLDDFARKVMTYDKDKLYIYFDSPGGSVFSLARMRGIMDSSNIKFICVARFAASAAFSLFQGCSERYMLPDGIIMQHNASGFFFGELPRLKERIRVFQSILDRMEKKDANRMKVSLKFFKHKINKEWWMDIDIAKKYRAIDGVIEKVNCSKDLIKKEVEKTVIVNTLFGSYAEKKTFSACPLLTQEIIKDKKDTKKNFKIDDTFFHVYRGKK